MKAVISGVLCAASVAAGLYGASIVTGGASASPDAATEEQAATADTATAEPDKDWYTLKFGRPFVVPVTDGWRTQSLVVISLQAEVDRQTAEDIPSLENKMRDRIMASLMAQSHDGKFSGAVTNPVVYDVVRNETRAALAPFFGEEIGDVMVLELIKRSV